MENKTLQPTLRFPEFSEDWVEKKLGEITLKVGSGKTPKGGEKVYQKNGIPFIRSQNVVDNNLKLDNTFITNETHFSMKSSKVIAKDILLNITGGSIGRSCVVPEFFIEGNVNQHVCIIRLFNEVNNYVIQSLLSSFRGQKQIFQGMAGGGREGINFQSIRNFKFIIPNSLPEQQKIANFLIAVDRKTTLLKEKKEALVAYKKGALQKLFSQEIRFKNDASTSLSTNVGNDFPDWEEKKLGEICEITTGKLDANAMVKNGKYHFYTCAKDYYYIDNFAFDYEALLISGNGANVGYVHHYKGKFNAYQRTYVLFNLNASYFYIKYFLDKNLKKRIHREKKDGNTPYIIMETLSGMHIKLPSIEEQTKIANYLSAIDTKITALEEKIKASEAFKKGLLQKMFV